MMSEPIRVSEAEMKRLEAMQSVRDERYQAWLEKGGMSPKRDIAAEAFDLTVKVGKAYLMVAIPIGVVVLVGLIWIWSMMAHDVAAFNAQRSQIQSEHSQQLPTANWPTQEDVKAAGREIAAIIAKGDRDLAIRDRELDKLSDDYFKQKRQDDRERARLDAEMRRLHAQLNRDIAEQRRMMNTPL